MPSSMMSPTRIITILSLVALCTLSFTVVFGSHNFFDTLTRDTLAHDSPFSLPKSNIVHHRRAFQHARQITPVASSLSNSLQSNPIPSQSTPSIPSANSLASSPAPVSSPSPSSVTQDKSSSAPSPSRATSTSPGTSAASASTSSSPSPTLSTSSSSSSNAQVSSSPGVTSSSVGATSSIANNPTTTFVNHPVSYTSGLSGSRPTNPGSTVSSGATPSVGAASGFFNNKAAVGATFSIIGIVGGLGVIVAVLTMMKRRRRARYAIDEEEFFEKYPSADPHVPPGFGTGSGEISPSATHFNMSAAPADAYPDRTVHYGQSNAGAVLNPVDYGIAYPPGAANNSNSGPAYRNGNTHEDTESEYSVPSASHPFADPANTSGPTAAPPVTYPRPIAGRAQEMVTTDSYYGPNSAGVGAGGVGYAE